MTSRPGAGGELLQKARAGKLSPDERIELSKFAQAGLNQRVLAARADPAEFFSFVMRHEETNKIIPCAEHQRFAFQFALHHNNCVFRWPTDTGKTWFTVGFALWMVGDDPTTRGLLVGKTVDVAKKTFSILREYLSDEKPLMNNRVRLVFPHLRQSLSKADQWQSTKLSTVRDISGGDPTYTAVGINTAAQGKKVRFIMADDMLDADNVRTADNRRLMSSDFHSRILGRIVPGPESRAIVTNVPWYPRTGNDSGDLTFELEHDRKWPTVEMDVYGNIRVANAADDFDTDMLRPSKKRSAIWYRMTCHDPDPEETKVLFPSRWPHVEIERFRKTQPANVFAQQKLCQPRSDEDARCKQDWIDQGKRAFRERLPELLDTYKIGNDDWGESMLWSVENHPVFTGVDLGIGKSKRHSASAFVSALILPDKTRLLLHVKGKRGMPGPEVLREIENRQNRYNCLTAVENNAAQNYILDFARDVKTRNRLLVRSHTTGAANKHHVEFGVESVFAEFEAGQWLIPCDERLICHPEIETLIGQCLSFSPNQDTGDYLMALWICRERLRRGGHMGPRPKIGGKSAFAQPGQEPGRDKKRSRTGPAFARSRAY